jgi:hypothetical protein
MNAKYQRYIEYVVNDLEIPYFKNMKEVYGLRPNDGFWQKWEYDNQGNKIYYGNSNGYWYKYEYDNQGNIIYYENSNGEIEDYR